MQFKPFEPGIEASGFCVAAYVEASRLFPSAIVGKLTKHGVGKLKGRNDIEVDVNAWYPQAGWLTAFEEIAQQIGPRACFQIGRNIPRFAVFPPSVVDIYSAIASADIAYHLNHRKNGRVMFDPATGKKTTGIGNYGCEAVPGQKKIISVCDNPYPCDFDRGILTELAVRFEKAARVTHDDKAPCRKAGANSCTYVITW